MKRKLDSILEDFSHKNEIAGMKGALGIMLVVTDTAREKEFPLDPESFLTKKGGQVAGATPARVQKILSEHGIQRILAKEVGRTSRGSLARMRAYVDLLNSLHDKGILDFDEVEGFWIEKVKEFFAGQPFQVKLDSSSSLSAIVEDLLQQAIKRQREAGGMQYAGAMLQHLVGAKLSCLFPDQELQCHSFSTADAPTGRSGDFHVGNYAVHVTMRPSEATLEKCQENLKAGLKPILVTVDEAMDFALGLASQIGIANRVDIFDIKQFIALNLHEWGEFEEGREKEAIRKLVERYNSIVEKVETDPSLRISVG